VRIVDRYVCGSLSYPLQRAGADGDDGVFGDRRYRQRANLDESRVHVVGEE
jgi:hypothetical protein